MTISKRFVSKYYTYLNKKIFENKLPPFEYLIFVFRKPKRKHDEFGHCAINYETGAIRLCFRYKKFIDLDCFLKILAHEMCHIADYMENGRMFGHGSSWLRWTEKAEKHLGLEIRESHHLEDIVEIKELNDLPRPLFRKQMGAS